MTLPAAVPPLVDKALAELRSDANHQLSPILRRQLYDAFDASHKNVLKWLEILTVRFVLPLWQQNHSWAGYPKPAQLVKIQEDRLRGVLRTVYSTHDEALSAEMVSLTGEDTHSPIYPSWCVFEAAVRIFFRSRFNPDEKLTDYDLKNDSTLTGDIAHQALIAYAGRIQPTMTYQEALKAREQWWREIEKDLPLPWSLTLDSKSCLEFWEWWLLEAIPKSWQLTQSTLPGADYLIQLKDRIVSIENDGDILYEDDEKIILRNGPDREILTEGDAQRVSAWLDHDYTQLLEYEKLNGLMASSETRPKNKWIRPDIMGNDEVLTDSPFDN
jgi:hypothetical protein